MRISKLDFVAKSATLATQDHRSLMFQTMNLVRITNLSLEHERFSCQVPLYFFAVHTFILIFMLCVCVWKEGGGEKSSTHS